MIMLNLAFLHFALLFGSERWGAIVSFGHKSFCFVALPLPFSLLMFTIVILKSTVRKGPMLLIKPFV